MLNIYLLGHGFILLGEANKFNTSTDLYTYVHENTMLDARGLPNLIQNSEYNVDDKATEIVHHKVGTLLKEHLLCSDRLTMRDINETSKWKERQSKMDFNNGWGSLYKLTKDTYIYVTEYGTLTRLSDIQVQIGSALSSDSEPHTLHWAACRTFVQGATDKEIIEYCTSDLSEPQRLIHS